MSLMRNASALAVCCRLLENTCTRKPLTVRLLYTSCRSMSRRLMSVSWYTRTTAPVAGSAAARSSNTSCGTNGCAACTLSADMPPVICVPGICARPAPAPSNAVSKTLNMMRFIYLNE